jgi:hypothetical protein
MEQLVLLVFLFVQRSHHVETCDVCTLGDSMVTVYATRTDLMSGFFKISTVLHTMFSSTVGMQVLSPSIPPHVESNYVLAANTVLQVQIGQTGRTCRCK